MKLLPCKVPGCLRATPCAIYSQVLVISFEIKMANLPARCFCCECIIYPCELWEYSETPFPDVFFIWHYSCWIYFFVFGDWEH